MSSVIQYKPIYFKETVNPPPTYQDRMGYRLFRPHSNNPGAHKSFRHAEGYRIIGRCKVMYTQMFPHHVLRKVRDSGGYRFDTKDLQIIV